MNRSPYILIVGLALLLTSCDDTIDTNPIDFGFEYFPLTVGKFIEYKVDSIIYDPGIDGTIIDTSTNLVREELVDSLIVSEQEVSYIIHRSIFVDSEWEVKDVWTTKRSPLNIERNEENLRFIKMVFPLSLGSIWQSTQFPPETTPVFIAGEKIDFYKNWESDLRSLNIPSQVGTFSFDHAAEIFHADVENLIEIRRVKELYAKKIGLVFREMYILDTQDINSNDSWEVKAEKGLILRQEIINFN